MRPDGVSVTYPFEPGTPPPSAGHRRRLRLQSERPAIVLFGEAGGTRLQFKGASIDLGATFGATATRDPFGAQIKGLALVLAAGESDGFIQKIMGDGETTHRGAARRRVVRISGVSFKGSGAFEVALQPHLSLGPIDITELDRPTRRAVGRRSPSSRSRSARASRATSVR